MKYIATAVVAQYDKEFNNKRIKELERYIAKLEREIEKLTEAALDMPKESRKTFYAKIERAGAEMEDAGVDLTKLRIASGIRYSEKDIES